MQAPPPTLYTQISARLYMRLSAPLWLRVSVTLLSMAGRKAGRIVVESVSVTIKYRLYLRAPSVSLFFVIQNTHSIVAFLIPCQSSLRLLASNVYRQYMYTTEAAQSAAYVTPQSYRYRTVPHLLFDCYSAALPLGKHTELNCTKHRSGFEISKLLWSRPLVLRITRRHAS